MFRIRSARLNPPREVHEAQAGIRPDLLCPQDGSPTTLVRKCAHLTGRRIHVSRQPLESDDPSGIWISTRTFDLIILDESDSPLRQDTALCHELAHIILGHRPYCLEDGRGFNPRLAESLFPHLSERLVRDTLPMMARDAYEPAQESEAESWATDMVGLLLARRSAAIFAARDKHW